MAPVLRLARLSRHWGLCRAGGFDSVATGDSDDDAAVIKVLYLAIQRAAKRWTMPIRNWVGVTGALNRFTIMFPDRMPT